MRQGTAHDMAGKTDCLEKEKALLLVVWWFGVVIMLSDQDDLFAWADGTLA
jgi:hypothetical protein